jgi:hypothetical protein
MGCGAIGWMDGMEETTWESLYGRIILKCTQFKDTAFMWLSGRIL